MQFSLLFPLNCDDTVRPYQISERFWIARLEQFPFVLHHVSIKRWICRYHCPFSKHTAREDLPIPALTQNKKKKALKSTIYMFWLICLISITFWPVLPHTWGDENLQQHCTSWSCHLLQASFFSLEEICMASDILVSLQGKQWTKTV